MRIPSFTIQNTRCIALADCQSVPPLMVIAGPNGTGKSTLLDALRNEPGTGHILYVGPHRIARRQNVQLRHLITATISFQDLLARQDTPGYEGIQIIGGRRDPWGIDDTANYLKHGLCQLESERQEAISQRFDEDGQIEKGSLPEPWKPLRELTNNLLPHLSFEGIDTSDRNKVRCLWRVHELDDLIDIDDLSSGEKAIIQIFYPLLEQRMKAIINDIKHSQIQSDENEICLLIDEPDLHLHPSLQVKVFDYFRYLSSGGKTQFIIATHSPAIIEYATFDELFLLRPIELVRHGENQLIQVASDEQRLGLLRNIFGTTSNITSLQPIVVIEGAESTSHGKTVPDRKLYTAIHQGFDNVTLISGGGKGECIKIVNALNEALNDFTPFIQAVALLDKDLSDEQPPENVIFLPVSMIENFLIDPIAIWEALQSVIERTSFSSSDDVEKAIDAILDAAKDREIERRGQNKLGIEVFRPQRPIEEIPVQRDEFIESLKIKYTEEQIRKAIDQAKQEVEDLKVREKRREYYNGKYALNDFIKIYLSSTGMSRGIFLYETARHARKRKSVQIFFDNFFKKLREQITV